MHILNRGKITPAHHSNSYLSIFLHSASFQISHIFLLLVKSLYFLMLFLTLCNPIYLCKSSLPLHLVSLTHMNLLLLAFPLLLDNLSIVLNSRNYLFFLTHLLILSLVALLPLQFLPLSTFLTLLLQHLYVPLMIFLSAPLHLNLYLSNIFHISCYVINLLLTMDCTTHYYQICNHCSTSLSLPGLNPLLSIHLLSLLLEIQNVC